MGKVFYALAEKNKIVVASYREDSDIQITGSTEIVFKFRKDLRFELYLQKGEGDNLKINGFSSKKDFYILSPNENVHINGAELTLGFSFIKIEYSEVLPNVTHLLKELPNDFVKNKKQLRIEGLKKFELSDPNRSGNLITRLIPALISAILIFSAFFFFSKTANIGMFLIISAISGIIVGLINSFFEFKNRKRKELNSKLNFQNALDEKLNRESKTGNKGFDLGAEEKKIQIEDETFKLHSDVSVGLIKRKILLITNIENMQNLLFNFSVENPNKKIFILAENIDLWSEFSIENTVIKIDSIITNNLDDFDIVISDENIEMNFRGLIIVFSEKKIDGNFDQVIKPPLQMNSGQIEIRKYLINTLIRKNKMGKEFENNFKTTFNFDLNEEEIEKNWQKNNELSVPVATQSDGSKIFLNLDEKKDGPHLLISGTTGSGKTQFLSTYLFLLGINLSPEKIGFLIIDFKGGNLINKVEGLPQLLGSFTNLNRDEIERSFYFIEEEIKRRQEYFLKNKINDVSEYEKLESIEFVPHLFIVVDEFAELKFIAPEYISKLISISRIGRSLGIHLILTTQRASGNISDELLSNISTKISFRSQSTEESILMLGTKDAISLKNPGDAIFNFTKEFKIIKGNVYDFESKLITNSTSSIEDEKMISDILLSKTSSFEKNDQKIIPEVLEDVKVTGLAAADNLLNKEIILDWGSISTFGVFGDRRSGKTNTIASIIEYSPWEEFIYFGREVPTNKKIIFSSKFINEEILDKVGNYLMNNPKTFLAIDDFEYFTSSEYFEKIIDLILGSNSIITTNLDFFPQKIQSKIDTFLYLTNRSKEIFSKYSLKNTPGRGAIKQSNNTEVVQISKAGAESGSLFKNIEPYDSEKIKLLPDSLDSSNLQIEDNKLFPLGVDYFSTEQINIDIRNNGIHLITYEDVENISGLIKIIYKSVPKINVIDPSGDNWQYKEIFENYSNSINNLSNGNPILILNLEEFIREFNKDEFENMIKNNPIIVFSDQRYFKHSFDPEIKIFKSNIENILEITTGSKISTLNKTRKIMVAA